jgi:ribonuclease-3 family protein
LNSSRSLALSEKEARTIAPRQLAQLGDAVYHLFLRENEILRTVNAQQMHNRTSNLASAAKQAELLAVILPELTESEADVVRRARNIKAPAARRGNQDAYRQSTAFEALIGYLYLTDRRRLDEILEISRQTSPN